ncbi:hypothetical protein [Stenotrophomonas indicatrix]|uniref:hypothetical protein n=1 Tax=Stenotrophomonas indicatrix TaxID=2045451 RepID=UPI001AA1D1B0|nr:hypothetical protein [Stenotrophomonas indicatrix]MBO1747723.1 hypothetical protein [Stenotrophomonas indicatrix]
MLALPESGVVSSRTKHNSDLNIVCDWIESSAIFLAEPITMSDVVDLLTEHTIYDDQDFAEEFVATAWAILKWRFKLLGNPLGIDVTNTRLSKADGKSWSDFPAYAFCMYMSCCSYLYPDAMGEVADSVKQGDIFEKISVESLRAMFPNWVVRPLGWSPDNPVRLVDIVGELTSSLREVPGSEVDLHVNNYSKELGLDILLYREFGDDNASFPVMMMQCASGKNWVRKRKTPDLSIWRKVISFNSNPVKGMVIPYSFADQNLFRKESTTVEGVFLDRYRLLAPADRQDWASADLNAEIIDFLNQRVPVFPVSTVVA